MIRQPLSPLNFPRATLKTTWHHLTDSLWKHQTWNFQGAATQKTADRPYTSSNKISRRWSRSKWPMKMKGQRNTRHFSKSRRIKTQLAMSLQRQRSTLQQVAYKQLLPILIMAKVWRELLRTISRKVWDGQARVDSQTSISWTIMLREKLSEVKKN